LGVVLAVIVTIQGSRGLLLSLGPFFSPRDPLFIALLDQLHKGVFFESLPAPDVHLTVGDAIVALLLDVVKGGEPLSRHE